MDFLLPAFIVLGIVAVGLYVIQARRHRKNHVNKKRSRAGCLVAVLIAFLLIVEVGSYGFFPALKVPLLLAFGWIRYLNRVIPLITPNWGALIVGVIGLGLLVVGVHFFLRWLYRSWNHGEVEAAIAERKWYTRWTIVGTVLFILMFATSIAFIGTVHQLGWLIKSDEPMMVSSWAGSNIKRSMKYLCQNPFRDDNKSASRYQAELWRDAELLRRSRDFHVLPIDGPEDTVGAVVVFPRDPVQRKEMGVRVCRSEREMEEHTADELPQILQKLNDGSLLIVGD